MNTTIIYMVESFYKKLMENGQANSCVAFFTSKKLADECKRTSEERDDIKYAHLSEHNALGEPTNPQGI